MKTIATIFVLALSMFANAEEASRMWTSSDGRLLDATLKAKTDTTATLLLTKTGKSVTIPLEKLSVSDRKYVADADLRQAPEMSAKTTSVKSNTVDKKTSTGTKARMDERSVTVELQKVEGRDLEVEVVFLGDDGGSKVGVFKRIKKIASADGPVEFNVLYPATSSAKNDDNYRGWAVRVSYKAGGEIARQASQKPFERYLDATE